MLASVVNAPQRDEHEKYQRVGYRLLRELPRSVHLGVVVHCFSQPEDGHQRYPPR